MPFFDIETADHFKVVKANVLSPLSVRLDSFGGSIDAGWFMGRAGTLYKIGTGTVVSKSDLSSLSTITNTNQCQIADGWAFFLATQDDSPLWTPKVFRCQLSDPSGTLEHIWSGGSAGSDKVSTTTAATCVVGSAKIGVAYSWYNKFLPRWRMMFAYMDRDGSSPNEWFNDVQDGDYYMDALCTWTDDTNHYVSRRQNLSTPDVRVYTKDLSGGAITAEVVSDLITAASEGGWHLRNGLLYDASEANSYSLPSNVDETSFCTLKNVGSDWYFLFLQVTSTPTWRLSPYKLSGGTLTEISGATSYVSGGPPSWGSGYSHYPTIQTGSVDETVEPAYCWVHFKSGKTSGVWAKVTIRPVAEVF